MNALTFFKTRLAADPEFDQSCLRLMILGSVFAYVATLSSGRADTKVVAFLVGYLAVAIGILAAVCIWPAANVSRRVLGMVVDAGAITFGLLVAGAGGVTFVWAYLFVIIGNGFRYGRIYLYVSQVLCMVGFLTVLTIAPWWTSDPIVGVGWLIGMMLLPLYVAVLAQRMRDAHLKTKQALKECLEREGRSG